MGKIIRTTENRDDTMNIWRIARKIDDLDIEFS